MQSHHPNPHPIPPTPSKSPSNSISQLHKTKLSFDPLLQPVLNLRRNKKLRTPSNIKNLTLDFEKSVSILKSSPPRKFFSRFLKDFRDLESLKIPSISFKNSPILMKVLRKFRGLKNLEVTFTRIAARVYKGDCLRNFISVLYKSCPRLAQLKLLFQDDLPITTYREDYSGSPLATWKIQRLSKLQKLIIHFPISTFMGEKKVLRGNLRSTIKFMDLSTMKRFNKLKDLDITMIQQPTDQYLEVNTAELCFDPNELFPNIKRFTWCVVSSRAPKKTELDIIGPQIASQLKHLNDFGLRFRKYHAESGPEMSSLSQSLADFKKDLNRLFFVYNCGEFFGHGSNPLISELSLKSLQKLPMLSLEFKNCKGVNSGLLVDLAKVISQNLTGLKSLKLRFESGKQQGRWVSMAMKTGYGLKEISDKGVEQFAGILTKGCENLEFVSLEFDKYAEITDKGVESLCRKLERLKNLKVVWIRFFDCVSVSQTGCQEAGTLLGDERRVIVSEGRSSTYYEGFE